MGFLVSGTIYVGSQASSPPEQPFQGSARGAIAPLNNVNGYALERWPNARALWFGPLPDQPFQGSAARAAPPLPADTDFLSPTVRAKASYWPDQPWQVQEARSSTAPFVPQIPAGPPPIAKAAYGLDLPSYAPYTRTTSPQDWRPPLPWMGPPVFAAPVQPEQPITARFSSPPSVLQFDPSIGAEFWLRRAEMPPSEALPPFGRSTFDAGLLSRIPDPGWAGIRARSFQMPPSEPAPPSPTGQSGAVTYWAKVYGGDVLSLYWQSHTARQLDVPDAPYATGTRAHDPEFALPALPPLGQSARNPPELVPPVPQTVFPGTFSVIFVSVTVGGLACMAAQTAPESGAWAAEVKDGTS